SYNEIAKELCHHPLVETDGAVFLVPSKKYDFKWLFYNKDGSEAEMCGNAARCVTVFAHQEKIVKGHCEFETQAGTIKGEVISAKIARVQMTPIKMEMFNQIIKDDSVYTKYDYIDSGVPHCVIKADSLQQLQDLRPLATQLRKPQYFAPRGANITFKVPLGKAHIESISFERGVEDFTEACGTGAVAAAYSHRHEHPEQNIIRVSVPGGELKVEFIEGFPFLSGAVNFMGEIQIAELRGEE
ncbi:MAG: diaminopimelate epimerase, partial [Bdellovibrionales bacterium]|nr:diaminopimelate epimerase [Bdellovibrionales bacterium]